MSAYQLMLLQALSIISSSWVFDLELIDKSSRDLFVHRLHRFLLVNRKVSQSEADYLNAGSDDGKEDDGKHIV